MGVSGGPARPESEWRVVVLGIAQDGGMPHPGCDRGPCAAARRGERPAERVACLGITDGRSGWLIDATPDFPAQVHALGILRPAGIFLTHAHMGHCAGLLWLGKEAMGARGVPVHATGRMGGFLRANEPWRRLLEEGRISLPGNARVDLGGARVSAFPVPHRDELSDTVGYIVEGPRRRVLYLPDIDGWDRWDRDLRAEVESADLAFLDGTFLSDDELEGRAQSEVPHPRVIDTMARLEGLGERVRLIHLNHTNPLFLDAAPAAERGFRMARQGEEHPI